MELKTKEVIVKEEVGWAHRIVDGFRCDKFWGDIATCDTQPCLGDLEQYNRCLEYRHARMLLHKIGEGEVKVDYGDVNAV